MGCVVLTIDFTLTVTFKSFSSYSIKQCATISGSGAVTSTEPITNGVIKLPPYSDNITMTVVYKAGSPYANVMLYTPTDHLQSTRSAASSTMTLTHRNGVLITFPSAANEGNLVTPTAGSVTMTIK